MPTSCGIDEETSNNRELIGVDAERVGCKGHDLRGATLVDGDVTNRRPMVVGHQRNERNSASDEGSRRVDVVRWPSVDGSHFVGNMHERRDITLTPRANLHLLTAALIRRRSVYRGGPDVGAWVWSHERRASPGC